VVDLVSKEHGHGASAFAQLPHCAASRLGTERQKHEARLVRYFAPVVENLGLTEAVQSHDWLPQKGHLTDQDRRSFRAFR